MKSIKSKIQFSMLSVVLVGSILIGVITTILNARGIDETIPEDPSILHFVSKGALDITSKAPFLIPKERRTIL